MIKSNRYLVIRIILLFWLTGGCPFAPLRSQNLIINNTNFNSGQHQFFSPGMITSPDACNKPVQVTGNANTEYKAVNYVHLGGGFNTSLITGCGTFHAGTGSQPLGCPTAIITGAQAFCGNTILSAASSANGGGTITSYWWQLNENDIQGATNVTYAASLSGNYTVIITNSNNCTVISDVFQAVSSPAVGLPTGLTATNITGSSAQLSWTSVAALWDIEFGNVGFAPGTGTLVTGITQLPYELTGLTPNTGYAYIARADCGGGQYSSWTSAFPFTTLPGVPANATIENVTISNGQSACYNATNTITVAGNGKTFTVDEGGAAILIAGDKIIFHPVVGVFPGGYMHGYIVSGGPWCGEKAASIVTLPEKESPTYQVVEKPFFTIYPNPTTGGFSLELRGIDQTDELRVEIYGMLGERVLSTDLSGKRKYDFSLAGVPNGAYFIRVVSGKFTRTGKVLKQ